MAVVLRSGLVAMKNAIAEYFEKQKITAAVSIGYAKRTQQVNQGDGQANRVVIIPSDDSGKAGKIDLTSLQPGDRPVYDAAGALIGQVRALRTWHRLVTVSVWACDASDTTDEDLQLEATDQLLGVTIRAWHRAAIPTVVPGTTPLQVKERGIGLANVVWGDVKTTLTPVDRSFGRELLVQGTYNHPIFDEVQEMAFPTKVDVQPSFVSEVSR